MSLNRQFITPPLFRRFHNCKSRVARKRPILTSAHKVVCFQCAINHLTWTVADWLRVIWSDESPFYFIQITHRVPQHPNIALHHQCVEVPSWRWAVMFWACFFFQNGLVLSLRYPLPWTNLFICHSRWLGFAILVNFYWRLSPMRKQ